MKPRSAHEDQPITMSGGSLKNQSGSWKMTTKKGTYQSTLPLIEVRFSCSAAKPVKTYSFTAPFTVEITYTDPNDASNFHTIKVEYLTNKKVVVTETDKGGSQMEENYLNQLLNHGKHPEDWNVTSITSSGGIALPSCGIEAKTFYLKLMFVLEP